MSVESSINKKYRKFVKLIEETEETGNKLPSLSYLSEYPILVEEWGKGYFESLGIVHPEVNAPFKPVAVLFQHTKLPVDCNEDYFAILGYNIDAVTDELTPVIFYYRRTKDGVSLTFIIDEEGAYESSNI